VSTTATTASPASAAGTAGTNGGIILGASDSDGVTAVPVAPLAPPSAVATKNRDTRASVEARRSPLLEGTGFVIGPYFALRKFTSDSDGTGEAVGAAMRLSLSSKSTIVTEIGYVQRDGGGEASTESGPGFLAGYEQRIALSAHTHDALLLSGAFGYERYSQSALRITTDTLIPHVRAGYRHVFGSAIGFEATGMGGLAVDLVGNVPDGGGATTRIGGIFQLGAAILFGL
jgi:hypothetical protein